MKFALLLLVSLLPLSLAQGGTMSQALEISSFKVQQGVSAEAVMAAATALNTTLEELGMVSRMLAYDEETETWSDIILWESGEAASAAPEVMMQREDAGAFFALMVPESVTMQHLSIMSTSQ